MHQQAHEPELLWTVEETIMAARTSRATLYSEINSGNLKTIKLGRRRYVRPEDARAWIAAKMEAA
jgi:hypothetical protein